MLSKAPSNQGLIFPCASWPPQTPEVDHHIMSASLSQIQGFFLGFPLSTLLSSLFAFVLVSNTLYRIVRWNRLRHVPGPPLAGWTSLWLTRAFMKQGWAEHYTELNAKYGPVVRVAPNKVVVNDVETLYRISSVRSAYGKDDWYSSMRIFKDGHHIVTLMTADERRERKKAIGPGVSHPIPPLRYPQTPADDDIIPVPRPRWRQL